MIDRTKYPKVAEDFEEWRVLNCPFHGNIGKYFHKLRPELQSGAYLRYFDECGVSDNYALTAIVLKNITITEQPNRITKALKSAIIEASDIREKELTLKE